MILLGWLALLISPWFFVPVVLGAAIVAFAIGDLFVSLFSAFAIAWAFERFSLTVGSEFNLENYAIALVPALVWAVVGIALGLLARKSMVRR